MPVPCNCCIIKADQVCYLPDPDDNVFFATFASQAANRTAGPGPNTFTFTNWAGSGVDVRVAVHEGETLGVAPGPQLPGSLAVGVSPPVITTVYVLFSEPVYLRRFGTSDYDFGDESSWGFNPYPVAAYGNHHFAPLASFPTARPPASENPLGVELDNFNNAVGGVEFDNNALTQRYMFAIARGSAGAGSFLVELGFEKINQQGRAFCFDCGGPNVQYFDENGDEVDSSQIVLCSTVPDCFEQELLMNGSFTQPQMTPAETVVLFPSASVVGWESGNGQLEYWNTGAVVPDNPNGGPQKVEVDAAINWIEQIVEVPSEAGQYRWKYSHRARPGTGVNTVSLRLGDGTVPAMSNPIVHTSGLIADDPVWHDYTGIFTKDAGITKLRFTIDSILPAAGSAGNAIDLCSLTNVCSSCSTEQPVAVTDLSWLGRAYNIPSDGGTATDEYQAFSVAPVATPNMVAGGVLPNSFHAAVGAPVDTCGGHIVSANWIGTPVTTLDFTYYNGGTALPVGGVVCKFNSPSLGGDLDFGVFASGTMVPGQSTVAIAPNGTRAKLTYISGPINANAPRGELAFCGFVGSNVIGLHRANISIADQPIVMRLEFFTDACCPVTPFVVNDLVLNGQGLDPMPAGGPPAPGGYEAYYDFTTAPNSISAGVIIEPGGEYHTENAAPVSIAGCTGPRQMQLGFPALSSLDFKYGVLTFPASTSNGSWLRIESASLGGVVKWPAGKVLNPGQSMISKELPGGVYAVLQNIGTTNFVVAGNTPQVETTLRCFPADELIRMHLGNNSTTDRPTELRLSFFQTC